MAFATASQVLNNKKGYNASGEEVVGNISNTLGATTYRRYYSTDQTIPANTYLTGNQTIYGIQTSNISASNYKYNYSLTVRGGSSYYVNTTGTYTNNPSSGQTVASAAEIMSGYGGYVKGSEVSGTMTSSDLNPYPVFTGWTITNGSGIAHINPSSGNGSGRTYTVTCGISGSGSSGSINFTRGNQSTSYSTVELYFGDWVVNTNSFDITLYARLVRTTTGDVYNWDVANISISR